LLDLPYELLHCGLPSVDVRDSRTKSRKLTIVKPYRQEIRTDFGERPRLCALSLMPCPRLTDVMPGHKDYCEPRSFPIDLIKKDIEIITPHLGRCVLVVEDADTPSLERFGYLLNIRTIFSSIG
jgi:hypothetical protein